MKTFAKVIGLLLLALVVVLMTAWGVCAIYWAEPPTGLLQTVAAGGFGLGTLLAFLLLPNRRRTLIGFLLVFAGVAAWWMGAFERVRCSRTIARCLSRSNRARIPVARVWGYEFDHLVIVQDLFLAKCM